MRMIKRFLIIAAFITFSSFSCFGLDWWNPIDYVTFDVYNITDESYNFKVTLDGVKENWYYKIPSEISNEDYDAYFCLAYKCLQDLTDDIFYGDENENDNTKHQIILDMLELSTYVLREKRPCVGLSFFDEESVFYTVFRTQAGDIAVIMVTK